MSTIWTTFLQRIITVLELLCCCATSWVLSRFLGRLMNHWILQSHIFDLCHFDIFILEATIVNARVIYIQAIVIAADQVATILALICEQKFGIRAPTARCLHYSLVEATVYFVNRSCQTLCLATIGATLIIDSRWMCVIFIFRLISRISVQSSSRQSDLAPKFWHWFSLRTFLCLKTWSWCSEIKNRSTVCITWLTDAIKVA